MEIEKDHTCPNCSGEVRTSPDKTKLACENFSLCGYEKLNHAAPQKQAPPQHRNHNQKGEAVQLFRAFPFNKKQQFFLEFVTEARITLQENFDPKLKICPIVSAGTVGTGKSTWEDTLLYIIEGGKEIPFKVGHTVMTQTEGIWMYPRPIFSKEMPDVQILLIDIEGMDGIRDKMPIQETLVMLQKLYLVGMATASAFCLHTNTRPTGGEFERLKEIFGILSEIKKTIGIEFPKIYLLVRDCSKITTNTGQNYEDIVRSSCEISDDLMKILKICPRGEAPPEFFKTMNFSLLEKTSYREIIQQLVREALQNPKKVPGLNNFMNTLQLLEMLEQIQKCINSADFKKNFLASLEHKVIEIAQPELMRLENDYQNNLLQEAQNLPLVKNEHDFDALALQLKEQYKKQFQHFLAETFKRDPGTSEVLKKTLFQFNSTLKDESAKRLFLQRKIENEKDEKRREELQELKAKSEKDNINLMKEIENNHLRMTEMEVEFAKQEADKTKQFEESLKKLIQERNEMKEEMSNEINEIKTAYAQELQNLNNSLKQVQQDSKESERKYYESALLFEKQKNEMSAEHNKTLQSLLGQIQSIQNVRQPRSGICPIF